MSREKPSTPETPVTGDTAKQLYRLRDLTRRTGLVHEAQAFQLKFWPQVLFTVKQATVSWDSNTRVVAYDILLGAALPAGEALAKRLQAIDAWVHDLLGPEWMVTVSVRRKQGGQTKCVHSGARLEPIPTPAAPAADEDAPFRDPITSFRRYHLNEKRIDHTQLDSEKLPPITRKT